MGARDAAKPHSTFFKDFGQPKSQALAPIVCGPRTLDDSPAWLEGLAGGGDGAQHRAKAQIERLEQVKAWLPEGCRPVLMGDRLYPFEDRVRMA